MSGAASTSVVDTTGPVDARHLARERALGVVQSYGAAIVLVLVVIGASATFPTFASLGNVTNILTQSSFPLIVAIGMTFVILTGGIDLSVGSVFALGGVLAAQASAHGGVLPALLLPLLVGAVIGAIQGALVAWGGMAPFIVTLAGLLAFRGVVLAVTDGGSETPIISDAATNALGQQGPLLHWTVWIALVMLVVGAVLLRRSRSGQAILAVGGSESAATLMGLPVARVKFGVYVLSGTCAALAGALNAAYSSSGVPTVGVGLELTAISAVVIGGTLLSGGKGSLGGTLAGVLLLSVISNVINQVGSLTSSVQSIVSGGFLAVVVVIQTVLSRQQRL